MVVWWPSLTKDLQTKPSSVFGWYDRHSISWFIRVKTRDQKF